MRLKRGDEVEKGQTGTESTYGKAAKSLLKRLLEPSAATTLPVSWRLRASKGANVMSAIGTREALESR